MSSLLLLGIVYTTFSDTFLNGFGVGGWDLAGLLFTMPVAYIAFSALFWVSFVVSYASLVFTLS